jgi:hypothetical protein
MNIYILNWFRLIELALPRALRDVSILSLFNCFVSPLVWLHGEFLSFRTQSLYKIQFNSQIVYLEAVLNDSFDPAERRIRIENEVVTQGLFLYEPERNLDVFLYEPETNQDVYLRDSSAQGSGFDFTVIVPEALQPSGSQLLGYETRMRGLVDYYKLYSKNYNIRWESI